MPSEREMTPPDPHCPTCGSGNGVAVQAMHEGAPVECPACHRNPSVIQLDLAEFSKLRFTAGYEEGVEDGRREVRATLLAEVVDAIDEERTRLEGPDADYYPHTVIYSTHIEACDRILARVRALGTP